MWRSIRTLRQAEPAVSTEEIEAAALQFVRKVSGYRSPSRANTKVFEATVAQISALTRSSLAPRRLGRQLRPRDHRELR